jgi:hypothetical protein
LFKRPMIALCITAITMLVTEAAADCPPHEPVNIGGSFVCPWHPQFARDKTQMTSESKAELATLVTEAIAKNQPLVIEILGFKPRDRGLSGKKDQPLLVEIPGDKPRDRGLSGKAEKVVQQQVQEMLKALNRAPDSVRVIFK